MRYVAMVRESGEIRSKRLESDNIRDLWCWAYAYARQRKNSGANRVTFRIWDKEADDLRKYARVYV